MSGWRGKCRPFAVGNLNFVAHVHSCCAEKARYYCNYCIVPRVEVIDFAAEKVISKTSAPSLQKGHAAMSLLLLRRRAPIASMPYMASLSSKPKLAAGMAVRTRLLKGLVGTAV